MVLVNYFRSFFDLNELGQGQFFVRYLTLLALTSAFIYVDRILVNEVNTDFILVATQEWTDNGYFFKKVVSFFSLLTLWLGLRRFISIGGFQFLGVLPFSIYILLSVIATYYNFEPIFLLILLLIPAARKKA